MRNYGKQHVSALWTGVACSPSPQRSPCTPRVLGEGAFDTLSALGTHSFSMVSDGQAAGGQGGQENNTGPPCIPTRASPGPGRPVTLR